MNYLKKELPHLHIDTDLDSTRFANPNTIFGRKVGIWEIECNRLDICKCVVFEFRIRIKQRTKENINGHPSFFSMTVLYYHQSNFQHQFLACLLQGRDEDLQFDLKRDFKSLSECGYFAKIGQK